MEIKKLEQEVLDCLKEFEFITDPEETTKHVQKIVAKLTELIKMNEGDRHRYENMKELVRHYKNW
ncbi:MAG: hypothetical protein NWF08_07840 [Candidatus Bathyarchaeota archaeon]|nr:hypothetical protein [Candidatus Bathyarchaeota archaeon]